MDAAKEDMANGQGRGSFQQQTVLMGRAAFVHFSLTEPPPLLLPPLDFLAEVYWCSPLKLLNCSQLQSRSVQLLIRQVAECQPLRFGIFEAMLLHMCPEGNADVKKLRAMERGEVPVEAFSTGSLMSIIMVMSKPASTTLPFAGKSALAAARAGVKEVHLPCCGLSYPSVKGVLWAVAAFETALGLQSNATKGQVKTKMAALKKAGSHYSCAPRSHLSLTRLCTCIYMKAPLS